MKIKGIIVLCIPLLLMALLTSCVDKSVQPEGTYTCDDLNVVLTFDENNNGIEKMEDGEVAIKWWYRPGNGLNIYFTTGNMDGWYKFTDDSQKEFIFHHSNGKTSTFIKVE